MYTSYIQVDTGLDLKQAKYVELRGHMYAHVINYSIGGSRQYRELIEVVSVSTELLVEIQ